MTDTHEHELVLTRLIDAPRALIYQAWTDPEMLKQWFAPLPYTTPVAELDVRPGGSALLPLPRAGEDLFLYVTDGAGSATYAGQPVSLGQYDVILAREDSAPVTLTAADAGLHALAFYLPTFLN